MRQWRTWYVQPLSGPWWATERVAAQATDVAAERATSSRSGTWATKENVSPRICAHLPHWNTIGLSTTGAVAVGGEDSGEEEEEVVADGVGAPSATEEGGGGPGTTTGGCGDAGGRGARGLRDEDGRMEGGGPMRDAVGRASGGELVELGGNAGAGGGPGSPGAVPMDEDGPACRVLRGSGWTGARLAAAAVAAAVAAAARWRLSKWTGVAMGSRVGFPRSGGRGECWCTRRSVSQGLPCARLRGSKGAPAENGA